MEIGICDMEANFVPGSGNQMAIPVAEWKKTLPLERLQKFLDIFTLSKFNYVELGTPWIDNYSMGLKFHEVLKEVQKRDVEVSAICSLMPANIRTVGKEFSAVRIKNYLNVVFENASILGVHTVVFGSAKSRMLSLHHSKENAYFDIKKFLSIADNLISKNNYNFRIGIETLNKSECNFINNLGEAYDIATDIDSPNIGITFDIYHANLQETSFWTEMPGIASKIFHMHVSQPEDRGYPGHISHSDSFDFNALFNKLRELDYRGNVSVEAKFTDLKKQISACYKYLSKSAKL